MSPHISEADKAGLEMQDWLQMPSIPGGPTSTIIGKNENGSGVTQDVHVIVWWRDDLAFLA